MLGAYGQRAASLLKRATPTVTNNLGFYGLIHRTCDVHTCCWAFGSGTVTACVDILCLLQPYIVYAYIMFFVCLFVCLFVCCGISSHSRIVHSYVYVIFAGEVLQTLMTFARHSWPLRWFFSMPHLLWHGAYVYDGHLRRLVTLTPIAALLAMALSQPDFRTKDCHG